MDYRNFCGGDNRAPALIADQETTINLIPERQEAPGADSKLVMYSVPGVTSLGKMGIPGGGRAHFSENGREYAVVGPAFVEIDSAGTATYRGGVALNSDPAQIRSNGDGGGQLLIVSGGNAYYYTIATATYVQITALNGKATMCGSKDGYGLVLDNTTSTFYFSALDDFSSWTTGTDFNQRSLAPDPWRALAVNGVYIPLIGEFTSEFWYDAGGSNNPFAPDPSGQISHGIAAPFSLAVGEGNLFWLAQSSVGQRYAVKTTGFTPEVISTGAINALLNSYTSVSDAQGEVINYNGHTIYRLTLPAQDITWCYDLSTGLWFQWGAWVSEQDKFSAVRTRWPVVAFGQIRVLDSQSDVLYKIDATSHTDVDSLPLVWERRPPVISSENELLFHQSLEVYIQPGVGLASGGAADVDPQVMLQFSNDAGANWSSERWRSMGKVGEYSVRQIWEQLGSARRRTYRVRGSAAVPACITGASFELAQPPQALRRGRAA